MSLQPKFLTLEIANLAVSLAVNTVFDGAVISSLINRKMCHVIVLAPAMEEGVWPNCTVKPFALCERSFGQAYMWPYPFDRIARCKALQLWYGRNDGGTDCQPHLLFPGDTPFWGGVKRQGIVVACSGIQPHFDRMIAGMVADLCIGMAYDAWMTSADLKDDGLCFLT